MMRHWQIEPPVHVLAAAWMGFEPPHVAGEQSSAPSPAELERQAHELMAMFGSGVIR